jgi:hypothetical protein
MLTYHTIQTTRVENHINHSPQKWISSPHHTQFKEESESQKTATKTTNLHTST